MPIPLLAVGVVIAAAGVGASLYEKKKKAAAAVPQAPAATGSPLSFLDQPTSAPMAVAHEAVSLFDSLFGTSPATPPDAIVNMGPGVTGSSSAGVVAATQAAYAQGATIIKVQNQLNALGFGPLSVDGQLGPQTTAAVKAFQSSRGLSVDGIPGPQTLAALGTTQVNTMPAGMGFMPSTDNTQPTSPDELTPADDGSS
jgi:murein L,D-transpeptidase YcbB/YkuD